MAAKLTPEQVAEIRISEEPAKILATRYGVAYKEVNEIKLGKVLAANKRERRGAWQKAHPEKAREASRKWREANPGKARERDKLWRAKNPGCMAALEGRHRAVMAGVPISRDPAITDFYICAATAPGIRCAYCKKQTAVGNRHVDHRTPLSRGGAHAIENLSVVCPACNNSKRSMTADEYLSSLAYAAAPEAAR